MNKSVPTGRISEFLNIEPLNPLISSCQIKVLYTGKNRNGSFISKDVAMKMAATLPGTPIIGEYLKEVEDFGDHGEKMIISGSGISFEKETYPFGFVPTDAKIWWQYFTDKDGVEREYLVTEGYLWTGMYPEATRVIEKGNHQSMELDSNSLQGEWSTIEYSEVEGEWAKIENDQEEYFIISDAVFSALCILGQDVEPCFEGANITKDANLIYSLNKEEFKNKMADFMADLKFALNKGGDKVEDNNIKTEEPIVEEIAIPEDEFAKKKKKEEEEKEPSAPAKEDPKAKEKDDSAAEENDPNKEKQDPKAAEEEEKKKKKKYDLEEVVEYQELLEKFTALEGQLTAITNELNSIKPEYTLLKDASIVAQAKAKDDMINSFYMLSDEDKKEVIENKANFSLEEIEAKLSVICVRKKVNFNLEEDSKTEDSIEKPITTFSDVDASISTAPAWLKAVDAKLKK